MPRSLDWTPERDAALLRGKLVLGRSVFRIAAEIGVSCAAATRRAHLLGIGRKMSADERRRAAIARGLIPAEAA